MGECGVRAWNGTKNQELMGDELTGASLNFRSALLLTLDPVGFGIFFRTVPNRLG